MPGEPKRLDHPPVVYLLALIFSAMTILVMAGVLYHLTFSPHGPAVLKPLKAMLDKKQKSALLVHLINENNWQQVLVFSRTKHGANRLTKYLEARGIKSAAIHGNKSQGARTKALAEFKAGKTKILVATDIAARGLDINQLPQVVNFDLPNVPEDYVHRIGRTGRAGATGHAVSLVSADEIKQLTDIERVINQLLTRKIVDDFEPVHDLPISRLDNRPIRSKKPKKPKQDHANGQRSKTIKSKDKNSKNSTSKYKMKNKSPNKSRNNNR